MFRAIADIGRVVVARGLANTSTAEVMTRTAAGAMDLPPSLAAVRVLLGGVEAVARNTIKKGAEHAGSFVDDSASALGALG